MDANTRQLVTDLEQAIADVQRGYRSPRCPLCNHTMQRHGPIQEDGQLLWYCDGPKAKRIDKKPNSKKARLARQHFWDSRTSRPTPDKQQVQNLLALIGEFLDEVEGDL